MTNQQKFSRLRKILDDASVYGRSIGKLNFDMQCCAPEEGMEQAGEDIAVLSKQLFRLTHSKTYARLVTELAAGHEGLSPVQQKVVEHKNDAWQKGKNISAKLDYEMTLAYNRAYAKWLEAKKANDYSIFRDAFADLIGYTRKAIDLRDEKKATYYDACLDDYEKGGSIAQLDAFFGALKERIVPLLARIEKDGKPIRTDFMSRPCPIPQQEAFSKYLLELEGLRGSALVLMTTEHPFTTNFGPHDVRVTTHYYEENFVSNIFTTLHEGGHALFMQNEPEEFYREHAANSMSNAMHECISRFYENLIGRSEAFIHFIYPKLREITGEITVDEIPALWNAKYKEYLGVDVPDDASGCLQDVHWSGSYGYFPSYALGSAYGAQILHTMQKELDVFGLAAKGDLLPIRDWLKEHVFSIASVSTPDEWIRAITGESLNVRYFLDYLEQKFSALYAL